MADIQIIEKLINTATPLGQETREAMVKVLQELLVKVTSPEHDVVGLFVCVLDYKYSVDTGTGEVGNFITNTGRLVAHPDFKNDVGDLAARSLKTAVLQTAVKKIECAIANGAKGEEA